MIIGQLTQAQMDEVASYRCMTDDCLDVERGMRDAIFGRRDEGASAAYSYGYDVGIVNRQMAD